MSRNGFTLVELLVALFIFSLIAVAGVTLLRVSVDGQAVLADRLGDMRRVERLAAMLEADCAQAVARRVRDANGNALPAFIGGGGGEALFALVRAGAAPIDGSARGDLQRVGYRLTGGRLERLSWSQLDGAEPAPPAVMLDRVTGVTLRFREESGAWRNDWRPTEAGQMPRAVELSIRRQGAAPLTMMALVGPQTRPKPEPVPTRETEGG